MLTSSLAADEVAWLQYIGSEAPRAGSGDPLKESSRGLSMTLGRFHIKWKSHSGING